MNIIRDDECHGIMMIPLFAQWGIRRCNVAECLDVPTTILTALGTTPGGEQIPPAGMCEGHYQAAIAAGGIQARFVWDDYDAFRARDARAAT